MVKDKRGDEPVVTVLMSCYNASRWLDQSIKSVLEQTFSDFEFIVIDDGSTDNTLEIIQRFAEQDTRLVVITKPNSGLADSLNVGIKTAKGEWIARIDADDICEPERLQKQMELARSDPGIVFVGSGLTIIDEAGVKHKKYFYPTTHAGLLVNLRTAQKFPPHSSAFYKTKIVRKIGGYRARIKLSDDCDLWLRLSDMGKMACLNESLVQIRKHADQTSHEDSGKRQLVDARAAVISYWLRHCGEPDPVGADEETYNTFRSWIIEQLERGGFFEFQSHAALLRTLLNDLKTPSKNIARLMSACLRHPCITFRFVKTFLLGERIAKRLAHKWKKHVKSINLS